MTESRKPRPPRELGRRGRVLWRELHEVLEYESHETVIVVEACRTVDAIGELAAALETDGYMTSGSTGQRVVHPAVAELRQQQQSLVRLLTSLNLDAALAGGGQVGLARAISSQASTAANARWAKSKRARGA